MKKKLPTVQTRSTAISAGVPKVYVRKIRGRRFGRVYMTLNAAGKRGLHYPPAQ